MVVANSSKHPPGAIKDMSDTNNWYPILDVLRQKYYGVIANIGKEIEFAKQYLGTSPYVLVSGATS